MIGYVIRRLIIAVIVTIGIAAITFAMLHYLQPSPAAIVLGTKARPEAIASWNKQHGYDRPEIVQFWSYLKGIAHFNFGYSYKLSQSVAALFNENAGRTAYLSGAALVLALLIAIPLGIYQAVRRNSIADYTLSALNLTLYSMPSFLLGVVLIQFFALNWNIFPPGVSSNITSTWAAITHPSQMVLPIATLTFITVASFSRYMRSSALDNLAQDYIRLARAKGLSERAVLSRHLLRNACLPMITLVGLSIPALMAGNLLIEYLFNYPGLGLLFYNALNNADYNIMLAYTILIGILTVVGNLIADIAITAADPRVRLT
ncbi:MAG TPA: ABC transporter permease [Solirubrobacteraceae bacterium]|jgi:peptide/nickel transport system permease protein|nr:ABC transporter permease [Solirubrobacteraceae bacterium]